MSEDLNAPINLKKELERKNRRSAENGENFDRWYKEAPEKENFSRFARPVREPVKNNGRIFFWAALVIAASFLVYWFFFAGGGSWRQKNENDGQWYAVRLVSDEVYYGQVADLKADPVVLKNVYYNYDQNKQVKDAADETGNLRLIKRGNETHGPDGSMDIIRSQIKFIEPLSKNSKVLKAILDYEK